MKYLLTADRALLLIKVNDGITSLSHLTPAEQEAYNCIIIDLKLSLALEGITPHLSTASHEYYIKTMSEAEKYMGICKCGFECFAKEIEECEQTSSFS